MINEVNYTSLALLLEDLCLSLLSKHGFALAFFVEHLWGRKVWSLEGGEVTLEDRETRMGKLHLLTLRDDFGLRHVVR